jgi:hypothetical protein
MRRFALSLFIAVFASVSSVSADTNTSNSTTHTMNMATVVVKSCLSDYTLHAEFSAAQLHSLGRPDATPANVNDVPLKLDGSFKYSDHIGCFYKSAKGDIFNLVYNFPCVNPAPANNGDPNAYKCKST